jgi:hypothetical protein
MNQTVEKYVTSSILDEYPGAHASIIATPVRAPWINGHKVTSEFADAKTLRCTRRPPGS